MKKAVSILFTASVTFVLFFLYACVCGLVSKRYDLAFFTRRKGFEQYMGIR